LTKFVQVLTKFVPYVSFWNISEMARKRLQKGVLKGVD